MKKISVVIPSYNSASTLSRTLEEVLKQPTEFLEEVLVVDSSDDGKTTRLLEEFTLRGVKAVRLDKKSIPAIGRNVGAEKARAEIIAFIDSDAYPEKNWLRNISAAVEGGCRVGGGSVLLPDFQKRSLIAISQYFLQFGGFTDTGLKRAVEFVPSCNLFCEKALFREIGGFPRIRACEDVLFGVTVNRSMPFYFFPEIKVNHIFRQDLNAYLKNQELLGRYIIIYRRQRFRSWIYRGLVPALLLPFFAFFKAAKIIARVLASGRSGHYRLFFICFPFFFLGLCGWSIGFLKGCFDKNG